MKVISTGLIGFGTGGRIFHAPIISSLPDYVLSMISTSNEKSKAIARSHYPWAQIISDPSVIIHDPSIELVIIATPNKEHFPLAQKALQAGKHVVVEKPFTVTAAEAAILIALAEQQQRVITVFHNRRWDSDFKTVQKVIENNSLGTLVEYEAHFDRFRIERKDGSWKEEQNEGSGILYDLGSHLIDQALLLFGLPDELFANLQKQRPGSLVTDQFELLLFYPGLKVTLKAGMLVKPLLPRFFLSGTNGSFVKYGMDVQEEALKSGQTPLTVMDWGKEPASLHGTIDTEVGDRKLTAKIESERGDYREFYSQLYATLRTNAPLAVTPQHARNTIKIIELAIRSHDEKCIIKFV